MADDTSVLENSSLNVENTNGDIRTTFGIIFLVIGLVASAGNAFILYVVKRDPLKCFNRPTNIFNIALTAAHLFAGIIVLPFNGVLNVLRGQRPDKSIPPVVVDLEALLLNFVIGTATVFLFTISTERSTAVLYPHFNKKWLTLKRAKVVSITAAVTCFVFCALLFLPVSKIFFYMVYLHVFILLPACGILASCAARLRNFKKQARVSAINSGLPLAQMFVRETKKRNSQLVYKLLVTLFSILLPVLFSLFLFYAVKIIEITCDDDCLMERGFIILSNVALMLLFLSSALNPLVLISRIPEYSRSIKHILKTR